jgi:hypothetical protein
VTKFLTAQQLDRYQTWFDNARLLRELVSKLEAASLLPWKRPKAGPTTLNPQPFLDPKARDPQQALAIHHALGGSTATPVQQSRTRIALTSARRWGNWAATKPPGFAPRRRRSDLSRGDRVLPYTGFTLDAVRRT